MTNKNKGRPGRVSSLRMAGVFQKRPRPSQNQARAGHPGSGQVRPEHSSGHRGPSTTAARPPPLRMTIQN